MRFPVFNMNPSRMSKGGVPGLMAVLVCLMGMTAAASPPPADEGELFEWGFRERIRQEYLRNCFDLENDIADDRNYLRFRTQIWCVLRPFEGITLRAGLNNEHREFMKPNSDTKDEIIFENLYLRLDRIAGTQLSIVAGRQDLGYGEGFLMLDGGPLDGSRTRYINAIRLIAAGEHRTLELHVLDNPHKDDYLPVIHNQDKALAEWDERGAGAHYTDNTLPWGKTETYYFFKREARDDNAIAKTKLSTVGVRISGKPREGFSYAVEGAYQFGERGDRDRTGFGAYAHGTYAPDLRWRPRITAGAYYLSGDDKETDEYEGWDPLYSRWPKWSDLYIFSLVNESGAAYWDNLAVPNVTLGANPLDDVDLTATYFYLYAPELAPMEYEEIGGEIYRQPAAPFAWGKERGHLTKVKLKWTIDRGMSCYILWERLDPGNYYRESSDLVHFLRWELMYTF